MKNLAKYFILIIPFVMIFTVCVMGFFVTPATPVAFAASSKTMTRQGDTIWFGYYPQTKATDDELSHMSATADANGYFTSGNDKFVKVTSADPKLHSETADTDYIPFDDDTQPVPGATYYFKMEPIEWNVMVDDAEHDTVKLVSRYYLDTHAWLTQYVQQGSWYHYVNTLEGVPADTPANQWRYSEIRAWLNDGFLNFAFTEDEQKSIYLFANTHTLDYLRSGKQESAIVNDYIAVGNRDDYDAAGNNGRPTDYAIVKGATWCYNKDHIYYWVNDDFQNFPENTVRLYRHDEHEKCAYADRVEAVRPIIYVKRGDAKIIATVTQKEEKQQSGLLIAGIVLAVVGAGLALPIMIITSTKQNKIKKETGNDYKLSKFEVALLVPGLIMLIGGCVMIGIHVALNGGLGGLGGTKLQPGIYVQQGQFSGGGIAQVGYTAYRLNADGTFDYTDSYDHNPVIWSGHGTWKQNGSKVTFVWDGNPMVQAGYTVTVPVKSSTSFGTSGADLFKKT